MQSNNCVLCESDGGILIIKTPYWRLIRATDQAGFPLVYRVIWTSHAAEFSDLSLKDRTRCMEAVAWVETAIRQFLRPDKINLAALGNMAPHLHWHIIPRYSWDTHFPNPIWGDALREVSPERWKGLQKQRDALECYLKDNGTTHTL